jgi:hypothetical protein
MTTEELIAQSKAREAKLEQAQFECMQMLKNRLTPIVENCKKRLELEKAVEAADKLKKRKRNNRNTTFIPL